MFKYILVFWLALAGFMPMMAQDPTKPATYSKPQKKTEKKKRKGLTLNGIVEKKGIRMAIINNEILKVGDRISGYRVIAIGADSASLRSKTKKLTLALVSTKVIKKKRGSKHE